MAGCFGALAWRSLKVRSWLEWHVTEQQRVRVPVQGRGGKANAGSPWKSSPFFTELRGKVRAVWGVRRRR